MGGHILIFNAMMLQGCSLWTVTHKSLW